MNLFLYLDRSSPVHRLDPRTKLGLLLASFFSAVLFVTPGPLVGLLGVLLAYGAVGRALGNLRRIWFLLLSIAAVSVVSWSIFAGGTTPLVWRVTTESLTYGVGAALKIDAMIVSGLVFLSTTRTEEMVLGLIRMRVPFPMAFAFSLAIRMVPTIIGTAVTVTEAQRSRGLDTRERRTAGAAADLRPAPRADLPPHAPKHGSARQGAGIARLRGSPGADIAPHDRLSRAGRRGPRRRAGGAGTVCGNPSPVGSVTRLRAPRPGPRRAAHVA